MEYLELAMVVNLTDCWYEQSQYGDSWNILLDTSWNDTQSEMSPERM